MDSISNIRERLDELELLVSRLGKRAEYRKSVSVPPLVLGGEVSYSIASRGGKCLCEVVLAGGEQAEMIVTLGGVVNNFPTCIGKVESYLDKGQHEIKIKCLGANTCGGLMSVNGNNMDITGGV